MALPLNQVNSLYQNAGFTSGVRQYQQGKLPGFNAMDPSSWGPQPSSPAPTPGGTQPRTGGADTFDSGGGAGGGGASPWAGSGAAGQFFQAMETARPRFIQQQQDLLQQFGVPMRNALLNASPELAAAAGYFDTSFKNPLPDDLAQSYSGYMRSAQAARGFGGGGTGPSGEEAQFLTQMAEGRRRELLPQMVQFGQSMLGMSGLQSPPDMNFASVASAMSSQNQLAQQQSQFQQQFSQQQREYQDTLKANQAQADYAEQYTRWLQSQMNSVYGSQAGGGGSNYMQNISTPGGGQGQPNSMYVTPGWNNSYPK